MIELVIKVALVILLANVAITFPLLYFTYRRAINAGVYSYKTGMVMKGDKLYGTKTPVYKDPKTGYTFLGKTVIEGRT